MLKSWEEVAIFANWTSATSLFHLSHNVLGLFDKRNKQFFGIERDSIVFDLHIHLGQK